MDHPLSPRCVLAGCEQLSHNGPLTDTALQGQQSSRTAHAAQAWVWSPTCAHHLQVFLSAPAAIRHTIRALAGAVGYGTGDAGRVEQAMAALLGQGPELLRPGFGQLATYIARTRISYLPLSPADGSAPAVWTLSVHPHCFAALASQLRQHPTQNELLDLGASIAVRANIYLAHDQVQYLEGRGIATAVIAPGSWPRTWQQTYLELRARGTQAVEAGQMVPALHSDAG